MGILCKYLIYKIMGGAGGGGNYDKSYFYLLRENHFKILLHCRLNRKLCLQPLEHFKNIENFILCMSHEIFYIQKFNYSHVSL